MCSICTNLSGLSVGPHAINIGQHNMCAFANKSLGNGQADALRSACDEGDPMLQFHKPAPQFSHVSICCSR
jgi:hypothetical protein